MGKSCFRMFNKNRASVQRRRVPAHDLAVITSSSADDNSDLLRSLRTNILSLCSGQSQMASRFKEQNVWTALSLSLSLHGGPPV